MEINQLIRSEIINIQLLSQYQQRFSISVIDQLKQFISIKQDKTKQLKLEQVSFKLAQVATIGYDTIRQKLSSKKKTQITKLFTSIFLNSSKFSKLQLKRKQLLKDLKFNRQKPAHIRLFQELYQFVSLDTLPQKQIKTQKQIKFMLTSLKKMIGNQVKKVHGNNSYEIHVDIKNILLTINQKIIDTPTGQKLAEILNKKQNKNWFGVRIHKIIEQHQWEFEDIDLFSKQLSKIKVRKFQLRSNQDQLLSVFGKMKVNIKKLKKKMKINEKKKDFELQFDKENENKLIHQQINIPQLECIGFHYSQIEPQNSKSQDEDFTILEPQIAESKLIHFSHYDDFLNFDN